MLHDWANIMDIPPAKLVYLYVMKLKAKPEYLPKFMIFALASNAPKGMFMHPMTRVTRKVGRSALDSVRHDTHFSLRRCKHASSQNEQVDRPSAVEKLDDVSRPTEKKTWKSLKTNVPTAAS